MEEEHKGDFMALTNGPSPGPEFDDSHGSSARLGVPPIDASAAASAASPLMLNPNPSPSASHVNFHTQQDEDVAASPLAGPVRTATADEEEDELEHQTAEAAEMVRLSPKDHSSSLSHEEEEKSGAPADRPRHDRPQWDRVEVPLGTDEPVAGSHARAVEHKAGADVIRADAPDGPPVLIAFVNMDSGGKTGKAMATELIELLGKDRVFDLKADKGATRGLRLFKHVPNLRVVIGGGDGSINWVLSCMLAEGMTDVPAGCIPLGTGNDSSRAFGWGFKFPGAKKVRKMVERMKRAKEFVKYDRWHSFAQYDVPVTEEFADALPASLRPVRSPADLPTFFRHPKTISLPSPPPGDKVQPFEAKPRPHRAATIDQDAAEEGYNFTAVQLAERLEAAGIEQAKQGTPVGPDAALNASNVQLYGSSSAGVSPDSGVAHAHPHHPHSRPLSPAGSPVPAAVAASAAAAVVPAGVDGEHRREQGPGRTFGGQFNNYLSWGIDAQIQNQFHVKRESCRQCFCGRICNMAWMGCFGFGNLVTCAARELDASLEVRDENGLWVDVPIPPGTRSIVLLNTPTYGGGRRLWGLDDPDKPTPPPREFECRSQRQALDDGLIEIVAVKSMWHLSMIMGQMSRGVRLAQVNEARVTFRSGPVYCQADGEPFLESPPVTYHVRPLKPQTMLTRPEKMPKM